MFSVLPAGTLPLTIAARYRLSCPSHCCRKSAAVVLSQRAALFASAYSQLVDWQGELVTAGLKHTDASMHHLLSALERLGAAEDCVQLAKLHEEMKPGTYTAHRFALQVSAAATSG